MALTHNNNDVVQNDLDKQEVKNVELFKVDTNKIPLDNNSIDVAFSFIVFQHLEKIEIFKEYVEKISRIPKRDGIAIIYFGRKLSFSLNRSSKFLYLIDRLKKAECMFLTLLNQKALGLTIRNRLKCVKKL